MPAADMRLFAEALKSMDIDLRHWSSYGTVGTVGEDGDFDPNDEEAVHIAPDGVWVDVLLQPLLIPIPARVQLGVGGSKVSLQVPIEPGDEVLVIMPDGVFANGPVVTAILNSQSAKIPLGGDNKPIFQNDRVLLFSEDVPIDLRTKAGAKVRVEADGSASFEVASGKQLILGAPNLTAPEGVVNGQAIDSFTGATQFALGNASTVVRAKK